MSSVRPLIIGLAGGTGSGKTTIAAEILAAATERFAVLIPQDAYYRSQPALPLEQRALINYDEPAAFDTPLLESQLRALAAGQNVMRPVYDFGAHLRSAESVLVSSRPVIVVEGILTLHEPGLRDLMDVKVFVDAPPDERFIRRLERDVRERSRTTESVITQYRSTVKPMHDHYVQPSKQHADLIVPEGGRNAVAIRVLTSFVRDYLRAAA